MGFVFSTRRSLPECHFISAPRVRCFAVGLDSWASDLPAIRQGVKIASRAFQADVARINGGVVDRLANLLLKLFPEHQALLVVARYHPIETQVNVSSLQAGQKGAPDTEGLCLDLPLIARANENAVFVNRLAFQATTGKPPDPNTSWSARKRNISPEWLSANPLPRSGRRHTHLPGRISQPLRTAGTPVRDRFPHQRSAFLDESARGRKGAKKGHMLQTLLMEKHRLKHMAVGIHGWR